MSSWIGVALVGTKRSLDAATEQALVEQCRRQNFEAFGKLVDAYQGRVTGFVRRMVGNYDEALDLTQDVFVRAFQNFSRFDGRCSLRTWLFKIAYNLCIDRARRNSRNPRALQLEGFPESEEPLEHPDLSLNPENLVLNKEIMALVEETIEEMSDKLRTVLLLHDKEDLSYGEIAGIVGIPVGTVKSRLFLARAQLQEQLAKYLRAEVGL